MICTWWQSSTRPERPGPRWWLQKLCYRKILYSQQNFPYSVIIIQLANWIKHLKCFRFGPSFSLRRSAFSEEWQQTQSGDGRCIRCGFARIRGGRDEKIETADFCCCCRGKVEENDSVSWENEKFVVLYGFAWGCMGIYGFRILAILSDDMNSNDGIAYRCSKAIYRMIDNDVIRIFFLLSTKSGRQIDRVIYSIDF